MLNKEQMLQEMDALKQAYGEWSYDIPLPFGIWTRGNLHIPHTRLRRIVQVVNDLALKPVAECRVLDLGCLDGMFAIEFALSGAETVGVEIREANVKKAIFCKEALGLQNLEFRQDDVRNISIESYGKFDVILCSGILYHLPAVDAIRLIDTMYAMVNRLVVIDTHIALETKEKILYEGHEYWGSIYREFAEEASSEQKARALWASADNTTSFWFTRPSLINILTRSGFSSVYECFAPAHLNFGQPGLERIDRCTFVAVKDQIRELKTSPAANQLREDWPEQSLTYAPPVSTPSPTSATENPVQKPKKSWNPFLTIFSMLNKIVAPIRSAVEYIRHLSDQNLIEASALFNAGWYLAHNSDVADARMDPAIHYLRHGGFERRDPSPDFSSGWYLDRYEDVKQSGLNPLVHYLRYGKSEGRSAKLHTEQIQNQESLLPYNCPVCGNDIQEFVPLPSFYAENLKKYGWPFTFDDAETINPDQYSCPRCGASDRDRLYALYLKKVFQTKTSSDTPLLLDFAPSPALQTFLRSYPNLRYLSADKYMPDVDLALDIIDMSQIQPGTFDIFICSHVLEHVPDDRQALAELFRILKPGGFGILMVPIVLAIDEIDEDPGLEDVGERWRRFGQDDHVRLYSKTGFLERVEKAGFTVSQYGADFFGREAFSRHGITSQSILYVAEKK